MCLNRWIRPQLYASDQRLVEEAGLATSRQEVMNAIDRWQHRASLAHAWQRELLGWRVSSRRLMAVARSVFQAAEEMASRPVKAPATKNG